MSRYSRRLERRRRLLSRIFLFIALVVRVLLALLFVGATLTGETGAASVATAAILYIIGDKVLGLFDRFDRAARRASKGASAEEDVQAILAGFRPEEFFVLNDIPCPAGNVDHLVIARHGGIFVIETKSTKGRVEVSGDQVLLNDAPMAGEPVRQVLRNTLWIKERIGQVVGAQPYVTAILLFTDAFVVAKKPVRGVIISRPHFLQSVLKTPPNSAFHSESIWRGRTILAESLGARHKEPAA